MAAAAGQGSSVSFIVLGLEFLAICGLFAVYIRWTERERADLMRRNEELTDQILRNRGDWPVARTVGPKEAPRKVPGHFDGTLAPSQKEPKQ